MLANPIYNHIFRECNYILNHTDDNALKLKKNKLRSSCLELYRTDNYELQEFYSVAHEIRLYDYLHNLDIEITTQDDRVAGPDFSSSIGYIECVCATKGWAGTSAREYLDFQLSGRTNRYLSALPRLSSVIKDKRDKYLEYQNANIIDKTRSQIIAINSSIFSNEFHSDLIIDLIYKILYGIGCPVLQFDKNLNLVGEKGVATHCYDDKGKKEPNKELDFAYFFQEEYSNIAAILLTNNAISEKLEKKYVHLFLNPIADTPINKSLIHDIRYFQVESISDDYINFKWHNSENGN